MTDLQTFLDLTMCVCWMATYTLVLISTKTYKYPAISPYAQAIILPVEAGVSIARITWKSFGFIHFCYLFWSLIEIAIIVEIIRLKFLKNVKLYFTFIIVLSVAVTYLVVVHDMILFLTYFLTFLGNVIWLVFILSKNDYPFKLLNLIAFFSKFIGDAVAIPVYLGVGNVIDDIVCIALPSVDFLFIIVYFLKKRQQNNQKIGLQK